VQYCPYGAIYSVTGNAEDSQPVPKLSLNCYPNPMTSFTKIKIELPKGISTALLKVSNSKGQIVYQNQVNSRLAEIQWQGKDIHGKRLPAGIYFVTLFCGKAKVTHKLTLVSV
jgi:flagellar hook assembly protein FlgD